MATKCGRGKIRRKAYKTRNGVKVPSACITDRGKPGKGPDTLPKPKAGALRGWQKKLPQTQRMRILKAITKTRGCASVIRDLNLLRNITADKPTKKAAVADMNKLRGESYCKLKMKKGK